MSIIEQSMQGNSLKITLEITNCDGIHTVHMNGEEGLLECLGATEVDALSVGEILRCLYDANYGAANPRFDTTGQHPERYYPETPVTIPSGSYVTLEGYGQVRTRNALVIGTDSSLFTEGFGDD